jgi:hypothetical protein
VRLALPVKRDKGLLDIGIDPGFIPARHRSRAEPDDIIKCDIGRHSESVLPDDFGKRARDIQAFQRQYCPLFGFNPENVRVIARIGHWKNSNSVSAQQRLWVYAHF